MLVIFFFFSCREGKMEKPFIIYGKSYYENDNTCVYDYFDKNGHTHWFRDQSNKYNVGDTIK